MGSQVLHLLLDVIPGTRLGCGAWMTVIWESLEQSEMESAWTRFEIKLRSKWIQSWRLIDARARSSYQYVQSENWNLEFGNKLLDGSSLFLAWLKKVISERTFFHWWTFEPPHPSFLFLPLTDPWKVSHIPLCWIFRLVYLIYLHTPINMIDLNYHKTRLSFCCGLTVEGNTSRTWGCWMHSIKKL